jgi:hypothetical protein
MDALVINDGLRVVAKRGIEHDGCASVVPGYSPGCAWPERVRPWRENRWQKKKNG